MNKKYILWQFKKWLPFFGVALAFLFIIYLIDFNLLAVTSRAYCNLSEDGTYLCYNTSTADTGVMELLIPPFILALIVPFIVHSYRQSTSITDCTYQLPFKKGAFRRHRLLLALVMFLITFTIAYLFAMTIQGIKINAAYRSSSWVGNYQPLGYLYTYLYLLLELSITYFIADFFISIGNNYLESVVLLICGFLLLANILGGPAATINLIRTRNYSIITNYSMTGDNSFDMSLVNQIYTGYLLLADTVIPNVLSSSASVQRIVMLVITNLLGIIAAIYCLISDDPSGEYSGKQGTHKPWSSQLIHAAFFFSVCCYPGGSMFNFSSFIYTSEDIIIVILYIFIYYLLLAFYQRSPKLNKKDWIEFGAMSLVSVCSYLIFYFGLFKNITY